MKRKFGGKKESFKGNLKQTEGYTPKSALGPGKKAGKAREKRLEKAKM